MPYNGLLLAIKERESDKKIATKYTEAYKANPLVVEYLLNENELPGHYPEYYSIGSADRGSKEFINGDHKYTCQIQGCFNWFSGTVELFYQVILINAKLLRIIRHGLVNVRMEAFGA